MTAIQRADTSIANHPASLDWVTEIEKRGLDFECKLRSHSGGFPVRNEEPK